MSDVVKHDLVHLGNYFDFTEHQNSTLPHSDYFIMLQ